MVPQSGTVARPQLPTSAKGSSVSHIIMKRLVWLRGLFGGWGTMGLVSPR